MIININDLLIFLYTLKEFRGKKGIREKTFFPLISKHPSRIILSFDYDEMLEFCKNLNLIESHERKFRLTKNGQNIVHMQKTGDDLTNEQKKFIVENCLFGNKNFIKIDNFLRKFHFIKKFDGFCLAVVSVKPFENECAILHQLDVIEHKGGYWEINSEYNEHMEQKNQGIFRPLTQKQLDAIIIEQKRIGDLAEELTVSYEKKRLKKIKLQVESKKVEKISNRVSNKGYDVESFSKKSKKPNLFIEVKGRKWGLTSFIISINEIQIAKQLGDKYAIYFWNNLGIEPLPKKPLRIIHDPFRKLSFNTCKNCLNFIVNIDSEVG